jgi:hypothetical protein
LAWTNGGYVGIGEADFASDGAVGGKIVEIGFETFEGRTGEEDFGIPQAGAGDVELAIYIGRPLQDLYGAWRFSALEGDGRN